MSWNSTNRKSKAWAMISRKWGLLFDIAGLKQEIEELENKTAEPAFWEDIENSQKVLQKTKVLKLKVATYEKLVSELEDLKVLNELGLEEQDASVIPEVGQELERMMEAYNKLRLETMLNGPYDRNNAIMTLHAGQAAPKRRIGCRCFSGCLRAGLKTMSIQSGYWIASTEMKLESRALRYKSSVNAYGYLRSERSAPPCEDIAI